MKNPFKRPSLAYSLLVTVPSVLFFGSIVLTIGLIDLFNRRSRIRSGRWGWIATMTKVGWSRWMLFAHDVEVVTSGVDLAELRKMRGVVFVANHQSLMDIPALYRILPSNLSFVAKKELLKFPIFGWAAYLCGTVFIDRARGARNESLTSINEFLKNGISIAIFPEGTRSRSGELGPFKRGAFVLAIQCQAPIVPVTIFNSKDVMPKGDLGIAPGVIHVHVDPPIQTRGLTIEDRLSLSEMVRGKILKHLENFTKSRDNEAGENPSQPYRR